MENHDHSADQYEHSATPRGRAFLWGGIGAGLLLVLALLTHGFGLLGGRGGGGEQPPALVHQGNRIFVPENSVLRQRLTVQPAPAEAHSAIITAPGIVESDPARTVVVLPPGAGRVRAVKVALGDRVRRGQPLATIDSPDLAQAYDDNDKAASLAALAARNLTTRRSSSRSALPHNATSTRRAATTSRRSPNTPARARTCGPWGRRRTRTATRGC